MMSEYESYCLEATDNNSHSKEQTSKPFYHTKFQDSLEKIVLKKTGTEGGIAEKIFSNKITTIHSTIIALLDEIHLREALDIHVLNKINNDISWQQSQLSQFNSIKGNYVFEWESEVNKQISNHEGNIVELEKEKRKEYLECWRDLMELKKSLLSVLKNFWELSRKRELLLRNEKILYDNNND